MVRAAPILAWSTTAVPGDPSRDAPHVVVDLGNDAMLVMPVPDSFFGRGEPMIGAYFVLYGDGYVSWSPKAPFEEGYERI